MFCQTCVLQSKGTVVVCLCSIMNLKLSFLICRFFVLQQEAELIVQENHKAVQPAAHQPQPVLSESISVLQRESSRLPNSQLICPLTHSGPPLHP